MKSFFTKTSSIVVLAALSVVLVVLLTAFGMSSRNEPEKISNEQQTETEVSKYKIALGSVFGCHVLEGVSASDPLDLETYSEQKRQALSQDIREISEETINDITEAWPLVSGSTQPLFSDKTNRILGQNLYFLGEYGEILVFFQDLGGIMALPTGDITGMTIGSHVIAGYFRIYVWNNHEWMGLNVAYEKGLLTDDEIEVIATGVSLNDPLGFYHWDDSRWEIEKKLHPDSYQRLRSMFEA
ncbi:MAG: hypothetical protein ILP12_07875 [Lachnospiraceae bacterium]|nr:hypothetical protein [Lachnospiraceae bacterium]